MKEIKETLYICISNMDYESLEAVEGVFTDIEEAKSFIIGKGYTREETDLIFYNKTDSEYIAIHEIERKINE